MASISLPASRKAFLALVGKPFRPVQNENREGARHESHVRRGSNHVAEALPTALIDIGFGPVY